MIAGVLLALAGAGVIAAGLSVNSLISGMGERAHTFIVLAGAALMLLGGLLFATGWWTAEVGNRSDFFIPNEGRVYVLIMIVLFCGSQIGTSNMLLLVFVSLAGPWIVNGWLTYAMLRRLRITRLHPERVMAGDPFPVQIVVDNDKSRLACWLLQVFDRVHRGPTSATPQILFINVPPRTRRAGEYRLTLRERGRYKLGPLHVNTRFPLGLVQRGRRFPDVSQLLVYPRRGRISPAWLKQLTRATELAELPRTSVGIFHDDLHQLREYRSGDDSRLIHWRTSARMNELMVCEYHESRDRDLVLVVDAWQPAHPSPRDREDFERGLRYALTVATEFVRTRRGSALAVVFAASSSRRWQGGLEQQSLDQLLDEFALLESTRDVSPAQIVDHVQREGAGGARVEVVTCRPEQVREGADAARLPAEFVEHCVRGTAARELSEVYEDI